MEEAMEELTGCWLHYCRFLLSKFVHHRKKKCGLVAEKRMVATILVMIFPVMVMETMWYHTNYRRSCYRFYSAVVWEPVAPPSGSRFRYCFVFWTMTKQHRNTICSTYRMVVKPNTCRCHQYDQMHLSPTFACRSTPSLLSSFRPGVMSGFFVWLPFQGISMQMSLVSSWHTQHQAFNGCHLLL